MEVVYSNAQMIMHSKNEFYIDFYLLSADQPKIQGAKPLVRVYMNPEVVIKFRDALERNIGKFIEQHVKPEKVRKG
ncbi:DUF3467 domain-containing protein [Patescibacteria group bacterium]|nr:DUF3467 domain-containing protein [Patescibacteria group bacterium]